MLDVNTVYSLPNLIVTDGLTVCLNLNYLKTQLIGGLKSLDGVLK